MTVSDAVRLYREADAKIDSIQAAAKDKVAKLKEIQDKLEAFIKFEAEKQGVTSFKTEYGTAYFSPVDYVTVENWPDFLHFVIDNEYFDMLAHNCRKDPVKEYMEENKEPVPGIKYGSERKLRVRKN